MKHLYRASSFESHAPSRAVYFAKEMPKPNPVAQPEPQELYNLKEYKDLKELSKDTDLTKEKVQAAQEKVEKAVKNVQDAMSKIPFIAKGLQDRFKLYQDKIQNVVSALNVNVQAIEKVKADKAKKALDDAQKSKDSALNRDHTLDVLNQVEARGDYVKKVQQYIANWNMLFGEGQTDGTYQKSQWEAIPAAINALNPDNTFKSPLPKEAVQKYTDHMNKAVHDVYIKKMETYVANWDAMYGTVVIADSKGYTKQEWENTISTLKNSKTDNIGEIIPLMQMMDAQIAKVPPEKLAKKAEPERKEDVEQKETAERKDFAAKLDAYIEREKICKDVSSKPESFDPIIKKAEDQKAIALDKKVPFNAEANVAYLNERRAGGKDFLISCKNILDGYSKEYTTPDMARVLQEQITEFNELIGQDFETIDAARLQNAITRYKDQIDSIRISKNLDPLDKERADAKDPALQDDADEAVARKAAYEKRTPFLNVKQALARRLVVKDPLDPAKVIAAPGYEFVTEESDTKNKAVKAKAKPGEVVPPVPAVPKPIPAPTPAPGPDDKGKGGKGGGKKGPSESGKSREVTNERANELTKNYLAKNKLDTKAFGDLLKVDMAKVDAAALRKAVKDLQKKLGVKDDGIFGGITFGKLNEDDKKKLGAPAEKADDKPKNKTETDKATLDQFEKDGKLLREMFGDENFDAFEKIIKKYYSAEKGFEKSIVEVMQDPDMRVLMEKIQKKIDGLFDKAKESGELKNSILSIKHLGDDVFEMKLDAKYTDILKKYAKLSWVSETAYFKRVDGKYRKIDKPTSESSKTSAVWDSFEQGTPMFDRLNALPADVQKKFKDTVRKMVHANDDIRRAGITDKVTPVELDGVTFEVTMKKTDGTSNKNCSWSIRGEKTVIVNMNMWLLERMEKQVKNPTAPDAPKAPEKTAEAPSAETKFVEMVPEALLARYEALTPNMKGRYKEYIRDSARAIERVKSGEPVMSNRSVNHPANVYKDDSGKLHWTEGLAENRDVAKSHKQIPDLNAWYMDKIESELGADRTVYEKRFTRGLDETLKRAQEHAKDNEGKPYMVLSGGPLNEPLEKANATITYANDTYTYKTGETSFTDREAFKKKLVEIAMKHYDHKD